MSAKVKAKPINRIETNGVHESRQETVAITAPNIKTAAFRIIGTAPYVQQKFGEKAKNQMKSKQLEGSTAKKGGKRAAKDFQECYMQAQYQPTGTRWECGAIPATAFKAAMISACRLVDFKMTIGKLAIYVEADGYDKEEMKPLIRITKGKPRYFEQTLPNDNGKMDIRARPVWDPGWETIVRIKYDADRFTLSDVTNLLMRAGEQVGIGEGRPDSKHCVGLGWGLFKIHGE